MRKTRELRKEKVATSLHQTHYTGRSFASISRGR
jgi:hypothetical protein